MWNKTNCAYSKNATGSVNSAAQSNFASSVCVSVKQPRRWADYVGSHRIGLGKRQEPSNNAAVVAENCEYSKLMGTRTTDIAQMVDRGWCRVGRGSWVLGGIGVIMKFRISLIFWGSRCTNRCTQISKARKAAQILGCAVGQVFLKSAAS